MTPTEALNLLKVYMPATYPGADTAILAGSTAAGRATPESDLDLVVIFPRLTAGAYRTTTEFNGQIIEAFVHDPETLRYFVSTDRARGIPSLARMVTDGLPVPGLPCLLLKECRDIGADSLAAGPLPLTAEDMARRRYTISNLADDLAPTRTTLERIALAAELWSNIADFALRASGQFGGTGKGLALALEAHDPALAASLAGAVEALVARGEPGGIHRAIDQTLAPHGGRLVVGYEAAAPSEWRTPRGDNGT